MTVYRVRIEIDINARDPDDADRRARVLYALLGHRYWVREVLPDGIEGRRSLPPPKE